MCILCDHEAIRNIPPTFRSTCPCLLTALWLCDYISSLVQYVFLFVAIWRTIRQVRQLSDVQSAGGWRRMLRIFSKLLFFPVSADSSERCLEWHSLRSEGQVAARDHMALVREHPKITQKHSEITERTLRDHSETHRERPENSQKSLREVPAQHSGYKMQYAHGTTTDFA